MSQEKQVILMYHGIIADQGSIPPDREAGADLYDVSIRDFRQQMAFIKDNNCFVTTFEKERLLPQESKIILTFDDGEMNNYTHAFPILKEFGFLAYFFVTVNRIGKAGYMGWDALKALRDANMIIGSHSLNHEILTKLDAGALRQELEQSKQQLEDKLQVPIVDFSVPRGFYNKEVIDLAVSAGYQRIFISERKFNDNRGCFERVAVKGNWTIARMQDALHGRMPISEQLKRILKKTLCLFTGDRGYDLIRSFFLRKETSN